MATHEHLSTTGITWIFNKIKEAFYKKTEVDSLLDGKVDKVDGKGLSENDFTDTLLSKLNGIAAGANKTTVDSALSSTSTNPVQNKAINAALAGKVDVVTGKGLSANDYTTDEKTKLSGIAAGAQVNKIENVKVNGTALSIESKAVDVTVPTKLTDLTNDGDFVTDANYIHTDVNFTSELKSKLDGIAAGANKTTVDASLSSTSTNPVQNKAVNTALSNKANLASPTFTGTPKAPTAASGTSTTQLATTAFVQQELTSMRNGLVEIVQTLPATGTAGKIYMVARSGTGAGYTEYTWTGTAWEEVGDTVIDLSGYVQDSDLDEITSTELNTIWTNVFGA